MADSRSRNTSLLPLSPIGEGYQSMRPIAEPASSLPLSPTPYPPSSRLYASCHQPSHGPPLRPPRPQTSLPDLKPRLLKSPSRPSRPFDPFIVEQIRNAPTQIVNPFSERSWKDSKQSLNYKDMPTEGQLFADRLMKIRMEARARTNRISRSLASEWEHRLVNTNSSGADPAPSTPFPGSAIERALAGSPLYIPSNSSIRTASRISRSQSDRDLPCEKKSTNKRSSTRIYFEGEEEALTSLPQLPESPSKSELKQRRDFLSIAYGNTKAKSGPRPSVLNSAPNKGQGGEKGPWNTDMQEKSIVSDAVSVSKLPSSRAYTDSACSLISHPTQRPSLQTLFSTCDLEKADSHNRCTWASEHRNKLWILATILLVLVAAVGITGGILVKLSALGKTAGVMM